MIGAKTMLYRRNQWGYKLSYFHGDQLFSYLDNVPSEANWSVVVWIVSVAFLKDWYNVGSSPVSREGSYF